MDYEKLSKVDFDAIVTGELTHYALQLEGDLEEIICQYFFPIPYRAEEFRRLLLHREGLRFQDKIEIVRALVPLFEDAATALSLKSLLKPMEQFQAMRNALAHGRDVSEREGSDLKIETVSRSGVRTVRPITPESHIKHLAELDALLNKLQWIKGKLFDADREHADSLYDSIMGMAEFAKKHRTKA